MCLRKLRSVFLVLSALFAFNVAADEIISEAEWLSTYQFLPSCTAAPVSCGGSYDPGCSVACERGTPVCQRANCYNEQLWGTSRCGCTY